MTLGHDLPVREALPALLEALSESNAAVLEAPPGAGKTTLVPLVLKDEAWLAGKTILMLEPRRIAARAAATRMAEMLGESVGETVGYRVRHDVKVGRNTRVEVLTEALLTRRLQNDPSLDGVGLVIFDEFHERSLDADLALALALEAQSALNPELRILVMSATLDGDRVAKLLHRAATIRSDGRLHPVDTVYVPTEFGDAGSAIASAVPRALRESGGSVLAFLPGEAEIRSAERQLRALNLSADTMIVPLYGNLPADAQAAAISPAPTGTRKVVLATSIAETSLTIPDIRAVIDCGLSRRLRFDSASGMSKLVTTRVSLAAADQRRGRAGRVAPGRCYRLWREEQHRALIPYDPPEIAVADLASFALDLAAWGNADPVGYALLDQPPSTAYAQAQALLRSLDALDDQNRITAHGRSLNRLGLHPRLAHMIHRGQALGYGPTAAALAGLLSERDVLYFDRDRPDADLRARLHVFAGDHALPGAKVDRAALTRARQNARTWARQAGVSRGDVEADSAGQCLALAYPDRVGQRRGPRGSYRLRNGRGALLRETDALARETWIAVGELDQGEENARIFSAAPVSAQEIERLFAGQITKRDEVIWDARNEMVVARRLTNLGALILDEQRLDPPAETMSAAMLDGIAAMGLSRLPWTEVLRQLQARAGLLRQLDGPDSMLPDLCDNALLRDRREWLQPFLEGITRASHLARVDLAAALNARLGWDQRRRLDEAMPPYITVPTGSRIALDYASGEPVLAVRLQELFGLAVSPTVGQGRLPVTLQLLSPARRPVQITRDLAGFWAGSYRDVKKELKGRYPKHRWPDDPLLAQPTTRAKKSGEPDDP